MAITVAGKTSIANRKGEIGLPDLRIGSPDGTLVVIAKRGDCGGSKRVLSDLLNLQLITILRTLVAVCCVIGLVFVFWCQRPRP